MIKIFLRDSRGAAAVEYGMFISVIAIGIISSAQVLTVRLSDFWGRIIETFM